MPKLRLHESEEYKFGHSIELKVADFLRANDWYVIPSYDYHGGDDHAPRMLGDAGSFVLPDLDAAKKGKRIWVEVKAKTEPTLHRLTNTLEHGMSQRLYQHYLAVEKITGCPVHLVIHEQDSGLSLHSKLSSLGKPRFYNGKRMGRDGMVFWPRSAFANLALKAAA